MLPDSERREPCPQCGSEACLCACIPRWLVRQTIADIEELIQTRRGKRVPSALRRVQQDARYMRDFHDGKVRRTRRT
jgi:hypothetical protein